MAKLTKENITQAAPVEVHIPSWGGEVVIRSLTVRELQDYLARHGEEGMAFESMAEIVCACMVEPKFETADELMNAYKPNGIGEVFQEIQNASGLGFDDEEEDEVKKNLEGTS